VNTRVGCCLLLGALASVTSGCASSGATGDDYELVVNPPQLESVSPTISKQEVDRALYDHYRWTYHPGGWPAADIVFVRIKEIYGGRLSFVRRESLADHINTAFSARNITLGTKGTRKNVLGGLEYQYFSVDTVADCIFIQQGISRFSDQFEFTGITNEPLGDMYVRGWYCAKSSEPYPGSLFREFIESIGIRGYAVPDT
jgi:hypothetical protein